MPADAAFPEAKAAALVPQARKGEWDSRMSLAMRSTLHWRERLLIPSAKIAPYLEERSCSRRSA